MQHNVVPDQKQWHGTSAQRMTESHHRQHDCPMQSMDFQSRSIVYSNASMRSCHDPILFPTHNRYTPSIHLVKHTTINTTAEMQAGISIRHSIAKAGTYWMQLAPQNGCDYLLHRSPIWTAPP
jgi:hypothetical protein